MWWRDLAILRCDEGKAGCPPRPPSLSPSLSSRVSSHQMRIKEIDLHKVLWVDWKVWTRGQQSTAQGHTRPHLLTCQTTTASETTRPTEPGGFTVRPFREDVCWALGWSDVAPVSACLSIWEGTSLKQLVHGRRNLEVNRVSGVMGCRRPRTTLWETLVEFYLWEGRGQGRAGRLLSWGPEPGHEASAGSLLSSSQELAQEPHGPRWPLLACGY